MQVIRELHPIVDHWKVGKINHQPEIERKHDWGCIPRKCQRSAGIIESGVLPQEQLENPVNDKTEKYAIWRAFCSEWIGWKAINYCTQMIPFTGTTCRRNFGCPYIDISQCHVYLIKLSRYQNVERNLQETLTEGIMERIICHKSTKESPNDSLQIAEFNRKPQNSIDCATYYRYCHTLDLLNSLSKIRPRIAEKFSKLIARIESEKVTYGWCKVKEAAIHAGLSESTIRTLLKKGLKYSKLSSGIIVIKIEDLDNYLESFKRIGEKIPGESSGRSRGSKTKKRKVTDQVQLSIPFPEAESSSTKSPQAQQHDV